MGDARQAALYAAYRQIMAAARQGTISPEGALRWARRAAQGEPVDVLAALTGPLAEDRLAWMKAAARPDLAPAVLEVLGGYAQAAEPVRGVGEMTDAQADRLLPPRGSELVPGPGEMSNAEADRLLPPRSPAEFEARAQARDIRASRVESLSDAELYELLFGQEDE